MTCQFGVKQRAEFETADAGSGSFYSNQAGKTARIALKNNIPCQIAYEEYMGCGLGTCMGCVVKCHRDGDWTFQRVCREGPVFMAEEIVWAD